MDLNRVSLIGRITTDLEIKKMEGGASVLNFTLATNRKYKNKEGNLVEESEFHRCVSFGPQADTISKYVNKGSKLFLEGRLKTRKWEDTNGNARYTTEIVVENFIFLDSKGGQQENSAHSSTQSEPSNSSDDEELPF